jgi:alpha-amylase
MRREEDPMRQAYFRVPAAVMGLALVFTAASCRNPEDAVNGWEPTSNVTDWRDEVIYQLLTDRFANGDRSNDVDVDLSDLTRYHGGDWQGIIDRLPYLQELGVTTIWISPVLKNVEEDFGAAGYHGYWTQSFIETNPHFGDILALRRMVDACHEAGIKVILDVVTNHVGQLFFYDINGNGVADEYTIGGGLRPECPWSPDQCEGHPSTRITEYDPDFDPAGIRMWTSLGYSGLAPVIFFHDPGTNHMPPQPADFQNPSWYHRRGRVWDWNDAEQVELGDFPGGLKDIATERDDVRQMMAAAFAYWIDAADVDGFRIDTIKHVEHGFWVDFNGRIRSHARAIGKDNFFIFGEAFDGSDVRIGSYTAPGEFDGVFYFSQKYRVFNDIFMSGAPTDSFRAIFEERAVNYSAAPQEGGLHDAAGAGIPPTSALVNFIDNHDVPRFLFEKPDTAALRNALGFLLTTDGIPCIYYGTEQDYAGGVDPANREDLFASGYATSGETFEWLKALIQLRKDHAALRRGVLQIVWTTSHTGTEADAGILAFERQAPDEVLLVVINAKEPLEAACCNAADRPAGCCETSPTPDLCLDGIPMDCASATWTEETGPMCISSLGGRVSEGSVLVNLLDTSDRAMVQGPCAAGTGDWELSVEVPARGTGTSWGLKVYGVQ